MWGKTKEELIAQLLEVESRETPGGGTPSLSAQLLEVMMQMQKDQQAWLEGQQRRQEELLEQNQRAQREMIEAVLTSRASAIVPPSTTAGASVRPPKPTLQKLSSSDDIESYLEMLERVVRQ